ncbi:MAG: type I restriction endonuclease [Bacteroidota bacterium]
MQEPEYIYCELPAIQLFQQLGYEYYCADDIDERTSITDVVLSGRLKAAIKRINPWINDDNLQKAYDGVTGVTGTSLMEINEKVWQLIRGAELSFKQVINGIEDFHPVRFIDYAIPGMNDYLVINQARYHGKTVNSIPDLMVYVNGLPVGLIECKSPSAHTAWDSAHNDITHYQDNSEKLFHYNQICAGIWQVGGKYGAIASPKAFYSVYRTKEGENASLQALTGKTNPSQQDILIYNLFEKSRLLDIIRHFVIFELEDGRTVKKLPRYQQIKATNNAITKLQTENAGGVIWHTQGSGKSITMAYVTRKLQAPEYGFKNPTVIIMTDRRDLDRQIKTTFNNVGFKNVAQATSVIHLDKLLRNDYGGIITTTIQKFQETEKQATDEDDQTSEEENQNIRVERSIEGKKLIKVTRELIKGSWVEIDWQEIDLEELSQKENLYVLVDEAHRSQYGFLASFMRTVLPHAKFIAFTGTPISKQDKSTLGEFYGGKYIDVYTIKESVADGATVELKYMDGICKLDVKKNELDAAFNEKFAGESEEKKHKLKQHALGQYSTSKERLQEIAKHIIDNYRDKIYANRHKAMIVCDGRRAAVRYQEAIEALKEQGYHNFQSQVIITTGNPKTDDIAKEFYGILEWNKNNPEAKKLLPFTASENIKDAVEWFKLPFGDESDKEKSGKKKYDNTAFLIVSDMLLTGYDAPIASCLYLDKPLKEHNLLQAIARVNRSGKGKDAGFIVDYYGITADLLHALEIFDGDLRADDILKDINEELPKLVMNHAKLVGFFRHIKIDRHYLKDDFIEAAVVYIEPIDRRDEFRDILKQFNKALAMVLPNTAAIKYEADFKLFNVINLTARNAFMEGDDLKVTKLESQMLQDMIDAHLRATGVSSLLEDPISILDKDRFMEELLNASPATKELKMRNNLKHVIKTGIDKNPDFYKPLAQRLEELLRQREQEQITQTQLILAFAEMQDTIIDHAKEGESKGFITESQQAIYDGMKPIYGTNAEKETKHLLQSIQGELDIIGWKDKSQVKKDIENKIKNLLKAMLSTEQARLKAKEWLEVLKKDDHA